MDGCGEAVPLAFPPIGGSAGSGLEQAEKLKSRRPAQGKTMSNVVMLQSALVRLPEKGKRQLRLGVKRSVIDRWPPSEGAF